MKILEEARGSIDFGRASASSPRTGLTRPNRTVPITLEGSASPRSHSFSIDSILARESGASPPRVPTMLQSGLHLGQLAAAVSGFGASSSDFLGKCKTLFSDFDGKSGHDHTQRPLCSFFFFIIYANDCGKTKSEFLTDLQLSRFTGLCFFRFARLNGESFNYLGRFFLFLF